MCVIRIHACLTKSILNFQPPPTSTIPTFIYHDVEHERVSSHDVISHEVLKEDDAPVRMDLQQTIEPAISQEYMYDFGNGKMKSVIMLIY